MVFLSWLWLIEIGYVKDGLVNMARCITATNPVCRSLLFTTNCVLQHKYDEHFTRNSRSTDLPVRQTIQKQPSNRGGNFLWKGWTLAPTCSRVFKFVLLSKFHLRVCCISLFLHIPIHDRQNNEIS